MRKAYAIIASALLCAAAAQAQDAPVALVDTVYFHAAGQVQVMDGDEIVPRCYTLPSVNNVVEIQLVNYKADVAQAEGWQPYVVWTMGTGFAVDQAYEAPTELIGTPNPYTYGFTLNKEKWGNPSGGNYYVTVMLCFVKLEGEDIVDMLYGADDEPVMYDVSYSTPNVFPAQFLYAYPDGAWETGDSFANAYKPTGEGCRFNFNNIVDFSDNDLMGTIVYNRVSEEPAIEFISLSGNTDTVTEENKIPTGQASVGYNPLDGNYVVSVHYYNPNINADDITSIDITLMGMSSMGSDIQDEDATIYNDASTPNLQKMKKSRLAEGLGEANTSVDVYNLQGMKVQSNINKSDIKNLPAGLYIVEGKKVIIR